MVALAAKSTSLVHLALAKGVSCFAAKDLSGATICLAKGVCCCARSMSLVQLFAWLKVCVAVLEVSVWCNYCLAKGVCCCGKSVSLV